MKSLSLVLPVWNEETFIADVVEDIVKTLEENKVDYELLLVENGSSDASLQVIQNLNKRNPRCRVVIQPKGYGSAVIGGLRKATMELVAYMPSDGQIEPGVLIDLLRIMDSGKYDLAKINRVRRESAFRTYLSYLFNFLTRMLFGLSSKDINGSPKIFSAKWVPILNLKSTENLVDTEMMAKASRLKLKVYEIETQSHQRKAGKSHVNLRTIVQFFSELIQLRFSDELKNFNGKSCKLEGV